MKRRDFLKYSAGASAHWMAVGALGWPVHKASALTDMPLEALKAGLGKDDLLLVPSSTRYSEYNVAFNKRTMLSPRVRVVVSTAAAVQNAILWAKKNGVNFALRSGGHSYEGFSQSKELVIDVRGLNQIDVEAEKNLVTVGAGVALGDIYKRLAVHNMAIPAGSCFPVGVSGHTLGGGFGLLSRAFGLACDNVISMEMIDAFGQIRNVNDKENPDLFWALRGGGSGNFGVVTKFQFQTSFVHKVAKFAVTWKLPADQAIEVVEIWQHWLASLSSQITGTLHLNKSSHNEIEVHFAGLSIGTESGLIKQLKALDQESGKGAVITTRALDFLDAATRFNGGTRGYESVLMKAKSDYVKKQMGREGLRTLFEGIQNAPAPIAVMFDTYGGAINKVPSDATAFVHRGDTAYSIQYYMEWADENDTNSNLQMMRKLHDSMRPYVSGEAYVNYCDLDLGASYAQAYWSSNLPRLRQLKALYDPSQLFHHAQSI
jgi:FAD/FMN-containing dehydrogenase